MKSPALLSAIVISSALGLTLAGHVQAHSEHDHGHQHAQEHAPSAHHGIVQPFADTMARTGLLELKLHDDKGDLELWLTDLEQQAPYDLPLDAEIKVTFPDMNNKTVVLQVRNNEQNEDEDGKGNIRKGQTNYFIFPGESGESAAFLKGKDFSSKVIVTFDQGGKTYRSVPFVLTPHTH